MNRGILVTAYASLKKDVTYEEVKAVYDKYYANEQFVRVLDKDVCPQTKWVEGSNYVDVNFKIDPRTGGTEYEPDVRPAGKRRPVHAADVPVKKTEADNRRNLRKARIKE